MKSLNRIEIIVGGILVLIFLIWAYDTCAGSSEKYTPQEPPQQEVPATDEEEPHTPTNEQPTTPAAQPQPTAPVQQPATQPTPAATAFPVVYVKVAGLKLRDKPFITGSQVLSELPKNTALFYLNNKTDFPEKITLDGVIYNEPWIEVQTQTGQQRGWVYGGGVRFYKD